MPVGPGPYPAAVMVQGSGPNDRDETIGPNKPFRDIAEGLSSDGIAVLRYDKRTYAHIAAWRRGLSGVKGVKIETIPGLNHLLIAGEGKPSPSEYMTPGHVSPQVVTTLASFIRTDS